MKKFTKLLCKKIPIPGKKIYKLKIPTLWKVHAYWLQAMYILKKGVDSNS